VNELPEQEVEQLVTAFFEVYTFERVGAAITMRVEEFLCRGGLGAAP
jgi:hypothetical protein